MKRNEKDYVIQKRIHRVSEVKGLLHENRTELIGGVLYEKEWLTRQQQKAAGFLYVAIWNYIRKDKKSYELLASPAVICPDFDGTDYLKPDMFVIKKTEDVTENADSKVPEWVIEFSDNRNCAGKIIKRSCVYHRLGVPEYWIVNTDAHEIFVSRRWQGEVQKFTYDDRIEVSILDRLSVDFSEMER